MIFAVQKKKSFYMGLQLLTSGLGLQETDGKTNGKRYGVCNQPFKTCDVKGLIT